MVGLLGEETLRGSHRPFLITTQSTLSDTQNQMQAGFSKGFLDGEKAGVLLSSQQRREGEVGHSKARPPELRGSFRRPTQTVPRVVDWEWVIEC